MKILFWFNGSGGQRRERNVVDFPNITESNLLLHTGEIEDALNDWKQSLNSQSEYRRWGWDENFDSVKLEPLSKA
jgi:hypothetical protein